MLDAFIPEPPIPEHVYKQIRDTILLPDKNVKTPILSLTKNEIEALEQKAIPIGSVKTVDTAVYVLSGSFHWNLAKDDPALAGRISRILSISTEVKALRKYMREGLNAAPHQESVTTALNAYKGLYNEYPKDDPPH
jgi:hypothetical protein